jgi:hypothetical protein
MLHSQSCFLLQKQPVVLMPYSYWQASWVWGQDDPVRGDSLGQTPGGPETQFQLRPSHVQSVRFGAMAPG